MSGIHVLDGTADCWHCRATGRVSYRVRRSGVWRTLVSACGFCNGMGTFS